MSVETAPRVICDACGTRTEDVVQLLGRYIGREWGLAYLTAYGDTRPLPADPPKLGEDRYAQFREAPAWKDVCSPRCWEALKMVAR